MSLFKSAIQLKREKLANINRVLESPDCPSGKQAELRAKAAKLNVQIAQIEQTRNQSVGAKF